SGLCAAFDASREVLASVDGRRDPPGVEPWGATQLARIADGLEIRTVAGTDMLRLPAFDAPGRGRAVMRIDVTSEAPSRVVLLYTTRDEPAYDRVHVYEFGLREGRDRVCFELLDTTIHGRMLLRLGLGRTRSVLHSLEVRAVPEASATPR